MKTLTLLRRRDESAWSEYVTLQTAAIERKHRRELIGDIVLGIVVFGAGAYLLCEPVAYFVARFWK